MDTLRQWFTEGSTLLTVLGLSFVGLASAVRWVSVRVVRELNRQLDQRRLGQGYATWRRLAELSPGPGDAGSLVGRIVSTKTQLAGLIDNSLRDELAVRLDRAASATLDVTYHDLLGGSGLLIPTRFVSSTGDLVVSVDLPERLYGGLGRPGGSRPGDPGRNILVIGPPGAGKSMVCRALEHFWLTAGTSDRWVVTIDGSDFVESRNPGALANVGSKEWLVATLERRLLHGPLSAFERRVLAELLDVQVSFLIDGIDEIADHLGPADMDTFLNSWLFARAECATVRSSYYESALFGSPAVRRCHTVFCEEPDEAQLQTYTEALCRRIHPPAEAAGRAAAVGELRRRIPDLRELTHNPLLLTMCVSLRGFDATEDVLDVSTVYREFVRQSLSRESKAGRMAVPADVVSAVLAEIAWTRFRGSNRRPTGRRALAAAVASVPEVSESDRQAVVDAVESCPLLTLRHTPLAELDEYDATFYHKSFEDYFVARRVEEWLRGRSANGADFFDYIDTPEVTFFLKEAIVRLCADPLARRSAARRLQEALTAALRATREASDERTARQRTFAAGQFAYYLGMVCEGPSRTWLVDLLSAESDFWVRRCGAIGLAFGGAPDVFNSFIDEMRAGIASGDFAMARQNIGVELGFYGDQEFDPLDPTSDAGGESCTRLVGRSLLELRMDVEAANWRMILFNLLYLARYRKSSSTCFRTEMTGRATELGEILAVIGADPAKARRPEIDEMQTLLTELTQ